MGIFRKCERFCGFYIPNTYSQFPPILFIREYVVMKWLQGQGVQGGNNILMEMCIKVPKKEEVLHKHFPTLQLHSLCPKIKMEENILSVVKGFLGISICIL